MLASRFVRVVAAVVGGTLVAAVASSPAQAATVSIKSFSVSPAKIGAAGGKITFKAKTSGATACSLTSSVKLKGLPATVACSSGSSTKSITFPGKVSTSDKSVRFTFTARNGSLATTAKVTVTRLASAPEVVKIVHAVTKGSTSDSLRIRATVQYAKTCTLSVSPAVAGLPNTASCAKGEYFKATTIPRNTSGTAKVYTVKVSATSPTGVTTSKTTKVSQAPSSTALPTITQFGITPSTLSASGGSYTVQAKVAHTTTCSLRVTPSLPTQPSPSSCTSGSYSKPLTIPKNTSSKAKTYTLVFTATNSSGSASATITATQPVPPPPAPTLTAFSSTPTTYPAAGTSATIAATIAHGSTCTLTSSPALSGLSTTPFTCTGTSVSRTVTVPANSGATRAYVFTLKVAGSGGTITGTLSVGQDGTPPAPTATLSLAPTSVPYTGGNYTVNGTLTNATNCVFSTTPDLGAGETVACTTSFSRQVTIPANTGTTTKTYAFTLVVTGPGGSVTRTLQVTQLPAPPSITNYKATPATITQAGGTITLSAAVAGAASCTFTPSPSSLLGSPTTVSCSGGTFSKAVSIPANTTGASRQFTFTLEATAIGGTASTSLALTQPAQAPSTPAISSFTISPSSVPASGGSFTINAAVTNASTCALSSSPGLGIDTTPVSCSGGSVSRAINIPANTGATRSYTFTLNVTGPGGTATGALTVDQPAATPTIGSFTANPATVDAGGGTVTFTGSAITNASSCTFTPPSALGTPVISSCAGGSTSNTATIPANTTGNSRPYTFTLEATGPGGSVSRTVMFTQPTQPVSVSNPTTSPTTVTSNGGKVTLGATVANATSCTWTSTPDLGISSASFSCTGTVSKAVTLPANTTASAKSYTVTLTVNGPYGPVTAQYPLSVPPAGPTLTGFMLSATSIPAAGLSNLTISANVSNASTCTFTAAPSSVFGGSDVQSCSSGAVSSSGSVPANTTGASRQLTFTLAVNGPGGNVSQSIILTQPSS